MSERKPSQKPEAKGERLKAKGQHPKASNKKQKLLILLLIPLGLLTKFYTGPGSQIINNHLGGVIYVVFFLFLASLIFPQTRAIKITLIV